MRWVAVMGLLAGASEVPRAPDEPRGAGEDGAAACGDIYVPPRHGRPAGDTYRPGTDEPVVIAGYSSGRIAVLRPGTTARAAGGPARAPPAQAAAVALALLGMQRAPAVPQAKAAMA